MLKNLLKKTGQGLLGGKGVNESSADAIKDEAKQATKKAVKKAGKKVAKKAFSKIASKGALRLLAYIMIPWGLLVIAILIGMIVLYGFFTSPATDKTTLTKTQEQTIEQDATAMINKDVPSDLLGLTARSVPSPQIIDNYIKYLLLQGKVKQPLTSMEISSLVSSAVAGLKPQFTFEDGVVTTTTTDATGHKTVTTEKVKLLKQSVSVYGTYNYTYKDQTTTEKNGNETITTTTPVLDSNKQDDKAQYKLLEDLLAKEGISKQSADFDIGIILFSKEGDSKSWNWMLDKKLPPPPVSSVESFGGGYVGGDIGNLPKGAEKYQQDFLIAAKATGIPNWFLAGCAEHESDFNPKSVSNPDGSEHAYGILQYWGPNWYGDFTTGGLGPFLAQNGYTGSPSEIWSKFMGDVKLQALVGAWEWRYYMNYALQLEHLEGGGYTVSSLNSTASMAKVGFELPVNAEPAKDTMLLAAYAYNCGQKYATVEKARHWGYSLNVYNSAMKYRTHTKDGGFIGGAGPKVNITGKFTAHQKEIIQKAIQYGYKEMGVATYKLGDGRDAETIARHSFDCSSFIYYIYKKAGYTICPISESNTWHYVSIGTKIPMDQLQPGDLIMFSVHEEDDHVGIYVGDGWFLDDNSKRDCIRKENLNWPYWKPKISKAIRLPIPAN